MVAQTWNGAGDYDLFVTLSEQEARKLADYYGLGESSWQRSYLGERFFCLVSTSRKALALLPFLSLAFGGMYDELPMGCEEYPVQINYAAYTLETFSPDSHADLRPTATQGDCPVKAYQWLGRDGYHYLLSCPKSAAFEIISRFGPEAKAPTLRADDGVKYSHYLVNTRDKIITPIRYLSWVFGGHVDEPLLGEECSVALFLDNYRFEEYPFRR